MTSHLFTTASELVILVTGWTEYALVDLKELQVLQYVRDRLRPSECSNVYIQATSWKYCA